MRLKLFKKYFLTTSAIIVFSLSIMMVILSFMLSNHIAKTKQETLAGICSEVKDYVLNLPAESENDVESLYGVTVALANVSEADVFLANSKDEVVFCSCEEFKKEKSCMHLGVNLKAKEVRRYLDVTNRLPLSTLDIYTNPHYVHISTVKDASGEKYATVFATAPISTVDTLLSTVRRLFTFSAIFPIILMFFAIYAITYRMTKPLRLMSEAAKAMAKGDFSKRIPVTSDDEIGELAVSFNMMTNSLSQLESMRKSFVANVSHEFRTPMTTIGGFIDGILDGTIEGEKQKYYLEIVSNEVKRLSRLVEAMLGMAKLESGEMQIKPEHFNLREMIYTIVIGQEQRIEKQGLNIIGLDELEDISITADRDLIYQAVYNLVDNAVKFTQPDGKITFSLKSENSKAILTVSNTGKGIPQKDLSYVFDRFYKVDKSRSSSKSSTGLGLYIVKTIIKAHSGSVFVSSKEDKYTAFKVVLPIKK